MKDSILVGTISGIIATLVKAISNLIFYKLNIARYLYYQIAASALILPEDINTPLGFLLGVLADIFTGGSLGVLFIVLINKTNKDYWFYKSIVFGVLVWLFGLGVILNLNTVRIIPVDPVFRLLSLIDHIIFGFVTGFLIIKYYYLMEKK